MIKFLLKNTLEGQFKIEKVNPVTGKKTLLADWFGNRIVNSGLDMIGDVGGATSLNTHGFIGSSAAATIDTQTILTSPLFSTGDAGPGGQVIAAQSASYYLEQTTVHRYDAGEGTGNIREVGVGYSGTLFARALVVDGGSNPLTLIKAADDIYDISYKLRMYRTSYNADLVSTFDIVSEPGKPAESTQQHSYTLRGLEALESNNGLFKPIEPGNLTSSFDALEGAVLAAVTALVPTQTDQSSATSIIVAAYTPGDYFVDIDIIFDLDAANFGSNITGFNINSGNNIIGHHQVVFTPAIAKTNIQELVLAYRVAWSRTTP